MSQRESADVARIRHDIERTRADMSVTIDAIQERLNPQHIADQVRSSIHDATIGKAEEIMRDAGDKASDVRYTLADTIRQNPIPAAMVAVGLGWLFMNRSSPPSHDDRYQRRLGGTYRTDQYGYRGEMTYNTNHPAYRGEAVAMYSRDPYNPGRHEDEGAFARAQSTVSDAASRAHSSAGDAASRAQASVGDAAARAQSAVGDAAQRAQEAAEEAAQRAQHTAGAIAGRTAYAAGRVEDNAQRMMRENPLAVGAIALAVGAVAGFALPQTERENEFMGEARDSLLERAQGAAEETIGKVQHVASEVARDVEQSASEKVREVKQDAERSVTEKSREAGLTGN